MRGTGILDLEPYFKIIKRRFENEFGDLLRTKTLFELGDE